jgi:membrane associated rhomboid family serine protease
MAVGASRRAPTPRALLALVGVIALIEVVLSLADAGVVFDPTLRGRAVMAGGFWASLLRGDAPLSPAQPATMFLSHAFLHGGLLHMVMNMTILLALGRFTADHYGPRAVLPVFALGAIGGGAAFGIVSAGAYPMVGASGAVFAFLGLWIAWDWRRHRDGGISAGPVLRRVAVLVGINVVTLIGLRGMLAWEAHLGGFLVGLACGWWLEGRLARSARAARAEARRRREGEPAAPTAGPWGSGRSG